MEDNQFDKHIRDQFRNQTIRPSESVWSEIEAGMKTQSKPWYKRNILWLAFLIFGVSLGLYLNTEEGNSKEIMENPASNESVFERLEEESHAAIMVEDVENEVDLEIGNNSFTEAIDEEVVAQLTTSNKVAIKNAENKSLIKNTTSDAMVGKNVRIVENLPDFQVEDEWVNPDPSFEKSSAIEYSSVENTNSDKIDYPKVKIALENRKKIKINPNALRFEEEERKPTSFISKVLRTVNTTGQEALYAISTRNLDKT